MKKTIFLILIFLSLSFSYGLNLNKPIEPLKKEIKTIIKYDCESKPIFEFIFLDLMNSNKGKAKMKFANLYLYLNKIKCD